MRIALFIPVILLTLVSLFAQTNTQQAKPQLFTIGGMRVEGNVYYTSESIISRSGLTLGSEMRIPGNEIKNAMTILWETGLFSDVRISKEKIEGKYIFLKFEVLERPRLAGLLFKGIKKTQSDDLVEEIQLKEGNPLTDFAKNRINRIIEKYYIDKGYLNYEAELVEKPVENKPNSVLLEVRINKNKKVKIDQIVFNGPVTYPAGKLKRMMKETKVKTRIDLNPVSLFSKAKQADSNFFHFLGNLSVSNIVNIFGNDFALRLFNSSKFIEKNLETDIASLEYFYKSQGFRDVKVQLDSTQKLSNGDIKLYVKIDEGNKYYFRNLNWVGNTKYPNALLDNIIGIKKGDIYSPERLQKKLFMDPNGGDVSSLYMDDGYLFFQLNPEETNIVGDSIDLNLNVNEGPQATIRNIIIEGNTKTYENVIRRELRTYPGYKFSRADIIRTQREIAALNFFDPEQIGIMPIPNQEEGTVDIKYTVVEKPSDQIELSAGYGGFARGLYGQAGVVLNNLSFKDFLKKSAWKPIPAGNGESLALRVQSNGRFTQQYSLSFTKPWVGGKNPDALQFSTDYTLFNTSGLPLADSNATFIISRGATIGFSKRLKRPDDFFNLTSSLTFKNYYLKNFGAFIIQNGYANNFALNETLSRNSTQGNPIFPSGGSNISLTMSLTPPYSLFREKTDKENYKFIEYHKWKFKADWYTRIAGSPDQGKRQLVLRTTAKFGFLGSYNKNLDVTTFERFRVGGDGLSGNIMLYGFDIVSLRGTEIAFAPVGSKSNVNTDVSSSGANAPIYNKFTAELRYPFSLNPSSVIFALAFVEGGNSYIDFKNYNPLKLRRSAGLGLRVFLPMFGLLGFDYGIGFDQPGSENLPIGERLRKGVFQFRLGIEPE